MSNEVTAVDQASTASLRVGVVANVSSGQGDLVADLASASAKTLQGRGHQMVTQPTGSIGDQLEEIEAETPDIIVAIGGDGTINAAATKAIAHDALLIVIPTGTMNLVAQDLGLPLDASRIVAELGALTELKVDYASVNGRPFLHSSLLGVVPLLSRYRERLRAEKRLLARLAATPRLVSTALWSSPLELHFGSDTGQARRLTRSVAVTNNPLAGDGMISHRRASVAAGALGVYASAHTGSFASLRLLTSLGTGRLPKDPETLSANCEQVTIRSRRKRLPVANDGEVVLLDLPLTYRVHPLGLRIGIPRAFVGAS